MSNQALNWAWTQPVGNPTRKLVLIALADHANGDGECWPTMRHIAQGSECSQRTVQRHIEHLETEGYVCKLERRSRRDGTFGQWSYRLLIPKDSMESSGHERPADTTDPPEDTERPADTDDRRTLMDCPADTGDADRRTLVSAQNPQENPQGNPQAGDAPRRRRKQDPIFDALVAECGIDPDELTKHERGKVNTAAKQLRDVGASADGIHARANVYRQRWPHATVTATGIANNYASLGSVPNNGHPPGESIRDLDENGVGKGVM